MSLRDGRLDWFNQANSYPYYINTSGTTNVFVNQQPQYAPQAPVKPVKEPTPMEWLRGEVEEMCALGRAA